jgi:hypothetical protein
VAVCRNCQSESNRIRTTWHEHGEPSDECPNCSPESFSKMTDPSDKKIWMGYEAHPNEYVKSEDGGYDRKPEYRLEYEARLAQPTEEEREAQRKAEAKKRAERRTTPMDSVELAVALRKAEQIADWVQASASEGTDIVH